MGVSMSYRESRLAAKVETLEKEKDDLVGNFTNIVRCLRAEVDKLKEEKAEMKTKLKELTTVNSNLRQQILEEKSKSTSGRKAEPIDDGELLSLGLSLIGFGPSRQKVRNELKLRRWRAHYGIGPKAVFKLMEDMKKYQAQPFNLLHLLMSIGWLKMYETEELLSGRWGLSEQTCRETVRLIAGLCFDIGDLLLVVGDLLLVVGDLLLIVGDFLLVVGDFLLVVGDLLLVVGDSYLVVGDDELGMEVVRKSRGGGVGQEKVGVRS